MFIYVEFTPNNFYAIKIVMESQNTVIRKPSNLVIRKKYDLTETIGKKNSPKKNKIIVKKKPGIIEGNLVVTKKSISVKKHIIEDAEDVEDIPNIVSEEIIGDFSVKKKTNTILTNEEMIENVEYQRDLLVKNRDKYKKDDYDMKLSTIEQLLSKLKVGFANTNLKEMTIKRVNIDKIVLDKKIPEKQFLTKIDLTGEYDNNDPNTELLTNSREYFKKISSYKEVPKELEKMDPAKNKNINFGNQKLPPELLKQINFN